MIQRYRISNQCAIVRGIMTVTNEQGASAIRNGTDPLAELTKQISVIRPIGLEWDAHLRREISAHSGAWARTYSDYQSGGWKTLSLIGRSADPMDALITDDAPVPTSLLSRMPFVKEFLLDLNFSYSSVRIARLEANSCLWEHRDYCDLKEAERVRLHIPIVTNPAARLVVGDFSIFLKPGFIWKLDPKVAHAANNEGREPRIHLILDIFLCAKSRALLDNEYLLPECVSRKRPLGSEPEQAAINQASVLLSLGHRDAMEATLLKLFHRYSTSEGRGYDLISQVYRGGADEKNADIWAGKKRQFLGAQLP